MTILRPLRCSVLLAAVITVAPAANVSARLDEVTTGGIPLAAKSFTNTGKADRLRMRSSPRLKAGLDALSSGDRA